MTEAQREEAVSKKHDLKIKQNAYEWIKQNQAELVRQSALPCQHVNYLTSTMRICRNGV